VITVARPTTGGQEPVPAAAKSPVSDEAAGHLLSDADVDAAGTARRHGDACGVVAARLTSGRVPVRHAPLDEVPNQSYGMAMKQQPRYEFRFAEPLSEIAQHGFPSLEVVPSGDARVLFGPVESQEALSALLNRFNTMRLTLVEVHRLPD
jgi:hypothetical protein